MSKEIARFQFGLNGVVSKANASLLTDSQYRNLSNMEVMIEGALTTRAGKKRLGIIPPGLLLPYIVAAIQKMSVSPDENPLVPSTNPRYLSVGENLANPVFNLYRTLDYATYEPSVVSGINSTAKKALSQGFSLAELGAGTSGGQWAFIASELKMRKDRGASFLPDGPQKYDASHQMGPMELDGSYIDYLAQWGILPAWGVAVAVVDGVIGSAVDGPDGGTQLSPNGSQPYDYRYCVSADTKVLCDDLTWRRADTLPDGQGIIAFDQDPQPGYDQRCKRRYRKAYIVSNSVETKDCLEICTDIGGPIKATMDHPWLVWSNKKNAANCKTAQDTVLSWKRSEQLKVGDKIAYFGEPWEEEQSRGAGWLAGLFDGEGSVVSAGQKKGRRKGRHNRIQLSVAQNEGSVLDRLREELKRRGIRYCDSVDSKRPKLHQITILGTRNAIKFLGKVRPLRLLEKLAAIDYLPGLKLSSGFDLAEVTSISPVGRTEIASIQTSCGTFITGGYLSHNTYKSHDTFNYGLPSQVMLEDSQAGTARSGGPVTSIVVNSGGAGYAVGDTGWINDPAGGDGAAFYEVVSITGGALGAGPLNNIIVDNGGTGYAVSDTGLITGGDGTAEYEVTEVSAGVVTRVTLTVTGNGYVSGSGVTTSILTGGGDAGLSLITSAGAGGGLTGSVSAIKPTSPGSGYVAGTGIATENFSGSGAGLTVDITVGAVYTGSPVAANKQNIIVTVYQSTDPQVESIQIWRRGGLLYDTWRLVGQIANDPNPGTLPDSSKSFTDSMSDADLLFRDQLELDNDPPIPSSAPVPIAGKVANLATGGATLPSWRTVAITMVQGNLTDIRPGTLMHFFYDAPEDVIIQAVSAASSGAITASSRNSGGSGYANGDTGFISGGNGAATYVVLTSAAGVILTYSLTLAGLDYSSAMNVATTTGGASPGVGTGFTVNIALVAAGTITAYFQHAHIAGADFQVDTITGQPAYLAITYGQYVIVAGDPFNPHLLYRSKPSQPESFPILPEDGTIATAVCGTPSNPILALVNFRGTIVTLNKFSMYETLIQQGSFVVPAQVANRGVVGHRAWCQTDNEIWFVAQDGVWSWDGGSCRKRSEAIDPIFRGASVDGLEPFNYAVAEKCVMTTRRGQVYLIYPGAEILHEIVCEPMFQDRWRAYADSTQTFNITYIYTEPDTQSKLDTGLGNTGLGVVLSDQNVVYSDVNYASDFYAGSDPRVGGSAIGFSVLLPWFDMGSPTSKKIIEEAFLEADATGSAVATAGITVDVYVDYSETATDTLLINLPLPVNGRQLISLLPGGALETIATSYGREARAVSFRISGFALPARITFFSLHFQYESTGMLTAGGAITWMDLGYKHDKKLYQMIVEFDCEGTFPDGTDRTILMDVISGRDGKTYHSNVQQFVISNADIRGSGRGLKSFPVNDTVGPVKMVRLRPLPATLLPALAVYDFFKIVDVKFEHEQYPPDVVSFTEWTTKGYEYKTYCNQITLDVNTNNELITVQLQSDATTVFTFTVQTTEFNRQRRITVPTDKTGYQWRLFIDLDVSVNPALGPTGTGMFQLWGHSLKLQHADKGEVGHTFDWDELGHPWDKYLQTVTVEWDCTGGADVTLQMDTLGGINGQIYSPAVHTFVLTGGRGRRVFPLNPDIVAKMIRLYPIPGAIPVLFKQWKYFFEKFDFPADIWRSTPWKHAETPNDENPSWLWIDSDTQSIAAAVELRNEDGVVMSFNHTGTLNDRKRNYPIPKDVFAKQWRLIIQEGTSGKFQLFSWGFDRWQNVPNISGTDPAEIILWVPWNDFGWMYDKIARNLILRVNTGGVDVVVHLETAEDGIVQSFVINQAYTDRPVHYACHSNLIGKQWRLTVEDPRPAGGLFQLWHWDLDVIREPAAVTRWDSYEQSLGYKGWKFVKQMWLMYACESPVRFTIISDTGTFETLLPPHPRRAPQNRYEPDTETRLTERFYLPDQFSSGLNKSKLYRIVVESMGSAFKFYSMSSGLEWMAIGNDRRQGYQQMALSEFQTLGEGASQAEAA